MLKVMLVEDEILVRVGIKSIIDWESFGYTVISEATNGAEALGKIKENAPDIVLTDLVMDEMDGFELISKLRKDYPAIRIIVLSCHNDFQNVKEAMRLGANDYVFKLTIKPDELIQTLNRVREGMEPAEQAPAANRIVHQNLSAIRSKWIHVAIERSYVSAEECAAELKLLGVKADVERPWRLLCLSADEFELADVNSRIKERKLLKFSMLNFISEAFERWDLAEVFDFDGGEFLVLLNGEEGSMDETAVALRETLTTLQAYTKRYLGIGLSAGMSAVHRGIRSLPQSYRETKEALETRFYVGGSGIHEFDTTPGNTDCEGDNRLSDVIDSPSLERALENLEEEHIRTNVEQVFDRLAAYRGFSSQRVRDRLLDLLLPFLAAARRRGVDLASVHGGDVFTPQQVIARFESLPQIREWFLRYSDNFVAACRSKNQARSREEIGKVKAFVQDHLHEEISVSDVATLVNMSESYFSHLFKKETGSSFVDFVNAARIEKAKELLLQTSLRVYEIAPMVGVENPNYFSVLFKKITGKSPGDYRR